MTGKNRKRSPAVEKWLQREAKEQTARYKKIEKQMNMTIAPERDNWIEAFLERIQTRGFFIHSDMKRKIKLEEIPTRPKRKFKVVF
ncbi:MAG: hypothetical protein ACREEM_45030 [Blastocatellia bacterium]